MKVFQTEFDITKYVSKTLYKNFFNEFKNMINKDDYLYTSEGIEEQLNSFYKYLEYTDAPNIYLNKDTDANYKKETIKNAKYVYFLANLLTYAYYIYKDQNKNKEEKIKILTNICQYLMNFEQNGITGIYFMNKGLNSIDYQKKYNKSEILNYLFNNKFIYAYNETLFKPKLNEIFKNFVDDAYITQNNLKNINDPKFNVASNSLFNDIIKKFIAKLNETTSKTGSLEEPEIKKQKTAIGGNKRKILKIY